jgi:hypothetical protein
MPRRHMEEWRYSSTILGFGTGWRWVVSFTPRPLYPQGNRPRYPLDRMLGLDAVEKRKSLHCRESNSGRPARSQSLYWLSYNVRKLLSQICAVWWDKWRLNTLLDLHKPSRLLVCDVRKYQGQYYGHARKSRLRFSGGVGGTLWYTLSWKHQSTYLYYRGTKSEINVVNY